MIREWPCTLAGAMDVSSPPQERYSDHLPSDDDTRDLFELQQAGANLLPRHIKAEANFLRLPLFALSTKGLRSLDGIECRGTVTRNGETHKFILTATRNTATLYPGLLARKAHLAFLSLISDRGLPVENPIAWSWRDLCKRMGVSYSGKMIENLKGAIDATKFLAIKSHYAIYSKHEESLIRNQEDSLSLYDRVTYVGSELPDGGKADTNYLWLSGWYIDNLNAMFTAPLDYELWRLFEVDSPIASRLYEFLLLNFYSGTPVLRINYETLAQFLPVKPEQFLSSAKRQFERAFKLLSIMEVIETATWSPSKSGLALISIYRGKNLTSPKDRGQLALNFMEEEFAGAIEVRELRNLKPDDWQLVSEFYRQWEGRGDARPSKKELEQARAILDEYGSRKAKEVMSRAVKKMKGAFPDAKYFGAIEKFLPDAAREFERAELLKQKEQEEQLTRVREREEKRAREVERVKFLTAWRPVWEALPEAEKDAVREIAFSGPNRIFRKGPAKLSEQLCLLELARARGAEVPAALAD